MGSLKAGILAAILIGVSFILIVNGIIFPGSGWILRIGVFLLIVIPIIPVLSYLQMDRKNPNYGVNASGILVNERGWNSAFFEWDEIEDISVNESHVYGKELHLKLKSVEDAIKKPNQKFAQRLEEEHIENKKPVLISGEYVKGDVQPLIEKTLSYFHKSKG